MASKKAVEKLVRALYTARKRGDYDAMAEMCAANGTLHIKGDAKLCPIARTTKGRSALRKVFADLAQFEFRNQKMVSLSVDGDIAAIHWRAHVTFKPTGKGAATEFCDLWTVKNGKIASGLQFIDTALVREMMG